MFRDFKKYEVFEDGRIWSYSHNKWLKPSPNTDGYLRVSLSDNDGKSKTYRLHRIVYEACSQAPIPEGMQVNHINEDKTDNRFENLNLMTCKENVNWGTARDRMAKALSMPVAQYDLEGNLIQVWPSVNEVQRQLGYSRGSISRCCRGEYKSAYGFIWKYMEN